MTKYAHVQRALRDLHKTLSWAHMGREVSLSPTTIKRFANNDTGSPHFHTVDLLSDYAGFRLSIDYLGLYGKNVIKLKRIKSPTRVQEEMR